MSELSIVTSCLVRAVAFAVLSNVAAQSPTQDGVEGPVSTDATVRVVALAASQDSAEPNLTVASDGSVILSWVEELAGRGHVLPFRSPSSSSLPSSSSSSDTSCIDIKEDLKASLSSS
mgnify:CR=1 FL=1